MAKAKKKAAPKKRGAPRRRMGAVPGHIKDDAMEVAGLIAASVGGTILQRQLTGMNPKLVSGAQAAVGYMFHRNAHPFMRGVGWGLLGTGAIGLTHEVGLIHGLEDLVSGLYSGSEIMLPAGGDGQGGFDNRAYVSGLDNRSYVGDMNDDRKADDIWQGVGL